MKPHTVNHISVKSLTAQEYAEKLERDTLRLHLRDYERAGVPVPDAVREKAKQMGIEVEE